MDRLNAYEALSEIASVELARLADQLNQTGFVSDEDGLCLGSMLIEHWSNRCSDLIRGYGYEGGVLAVRGAFFSAVGAIYVLYDQKRHSGEDAADELRRVAKLHST
ncbi:TPA: hypothetical protein ACYRK3_000078 [Stenotrophomonas maltophilia]